MIRFFVVEICWGVEEAVVGKGWITSASGVSCDGSCLKLKSVIVSMENNT